jgi:hypothetical protein
MSSRNILSTAKDSALSLFRHDMIFKAFQKHLSSKYKLTNNQLFFDYENAKKRLKDAVLLSVKESTERFNEIYGETDGETIWILRGLSLDECVETLLHEAMHDSVFIRRTTRSGEYKSLSCDLEHSIIYNFLDTGEWRASL